MLLYRLASVPVMERLHEPFVIPAIVARAMMLAERELPTRVRTPLDTVSWMVFDPDIWEGQEYCRIVAVLPEASAIAVAPQAAIQLNVRPF